MLSKIKSVIARLLGRILSTRSPRDISNRRLRRIRLLGFQQHAPLREGSSGPYFSQYGQDEFIWRHILKENSTGGFFCDVGAADGILHSNTLFFEQSVGWDGLCIEPNPSAFELLSNRRKCDCHLGGIGRDESVLNFRQVEGYGAQLSCFTEFADKEHLQRIQAEVDTGTSTCRDIAIQVSRLGELLEARGVRKINLLSIDAEGMEIDVLSSVDHDQVEISTIALEANGDAVAIEDCLWEHGYRLRAIVGTDHIYVSRG